MSAPEPANRAAKLEVVGLGKRFGGVQAVEQVSLQVPAGGTLGIIGPNGAGKTTLFRMIAGQTRPSAGKVLLDGRDVTGRPSHQICRAGVAQTHQLVQPFADLSVRDNVRVGYEFAGAARGAPRDWVDQVLVLTNLAPMAELDAGTLTVALLRRLEIARALATNPSVILLDEIAAGLTAAEQVECIALLKTIQRSGVSLVIVEHIMDVVVAICEHLVVLNFGEVIASGVPKDVLRDPVVMEAYLG